MLFVVKGMGPVSPALGGLRVGTMCFFRYKSRSFCVKRVSGSSLVPWAWHKDLADSEPGEIFTEE